MPPPTIHATFLNLKAATGTFLPGNKIIAPYCVSAVVFNCLHLLCYLNHTNKLLRNVSELISMQSLSYFHENFIYIERRYTKLHNYMLYFNTTNQHYNML